MPSPANLVHQQSVSTGTGNFTLAAVNGKQGFATAFGTGSTTDVFDYFISNRDASEWERGTGHMSDATTLVRDTVLESTNSNAAVSFSAGTKDVMNDVPAAKQVTTDGTQTLTNKTIGAPLVIFGTGQSNFVRTIGLTSGTWAVPPNLRVWNGDTTTAGNAWTVPDNTKMHVLWRFAAEVALANPTRQVYLVFVALGGTTIAAGWKVGASPTDVYAASKAAVEAALTNLGVTTIDIRCWWQGESDAASPGNYVADFETVDARYTAETWCPPTTPLVVFGIVGSQNSDPSYLQFERYLQHIVANDPAFRVYVKTRRVPLALWDPTTPVLHMLATGYDYLGKMAFQNFQTGNHRPPYEEGVFTPGLTFGGASTGITYATTNVGTFTRVGRLVMFSLRLQLTNKGTSTGAARITGFPAEWVPNTSNGIVSMPSFCGRYFNMASIVGGVSGSWATDTGQVTPVMNDSATTQTTLTDAHFTNSSILFFTGMAELVS